jgi:predicted Rdx family selenoprotein
MTSPTDPTLVAFGELLAYMYAASGVEGAPGSTTMHPLSGGVFEIRVGDVTIGTIHRDAILELADRIRMARN